MPIVKNHDLFPQEGEGPPDEIEFIQIFRSDGMSRELLTGLIPATDLNKEEEILERYGPGQYELVARARNRITRRRTVKFAGVPRAFADPAGPSAARAPDNNFAMLQLIVGMMQSQSAQTMAIMTGFMQAGDAKNAQMMAMMQESNKQTMTIMTEAFKASSQGAGGSGKEFVTAFEKGMSFIKEHAPGSKDATGFPGALDATSNFVGALIAAKQSGLLADFLKTDKPAEAPKAEEPKQLRAVPNPNPPPAPRAPVAPRAPAPPASAQHPATQPVRPVVTSSPAAAQAPTQTHPQTAPLHGNAGGGQNAPTVPAIRTPNLHHAVSAPQTKTA